MYLVLNLKVYKESYGESLDRMVQAVADFKEPQGVDIIIAPPTAELSRIRSRFVRLKVYAQTVDPNDLGSFTGSTPLASVQACGLDGFIINHSESKKKIADIEAVIALAKSKGMDHVVCVADIEELKKVLVFKPKMVAIEPPELIGSGISVSTAKPDIVIKAVEATKRISPATSLLVGAGISNELDVRRSIELGAQGVLLASAFVKAPDHKKKLEELIRGFKVPSRQAL